MDAFSLTQLDKQKHLVTYLELKEVKDTGKKPEVLKKRNVGLFLQYPRQ